MTKLEIQTLIPFMMIGFGWVLGYTLSKLMKPAYQKDFYDPLRRRNYDIFRAHIVAGIPFIFIFFGHFILTFLFPLHLIFIVPFYISFGIFHRIEHEPL